MCCGARHRCLRAKVYRNIPTRESDESSVVAVIVRDQAHPSRPDFQGHSIGSPRRRPPDHPRHRAVPFPVAINRNETLLLLSLVQGGPHRTLTSLVQGGPHRTLTDRAKAAKEEPQWQGEQQLTRVAAPVAVRRMANRLWGCTARRTSAAVVTKAPAPSPRATQRPDQPQAMKQPAARGQLREWNVL